MADARHNSDVAYFLVAFREVLEQDWRSSQWDCCVSWFLGKCWSRTGSPRSGTVVLVGFREVLEQDWWSSQWDCRVGWF